MYVCRSAVVCSSVYINLLSNALFASAGVASIAFIKCKQKTLSTLTICHEFVFMITIIPTSIPKIVQ
jgi:hypothetical protein